MANSKHLAQLKKGVENWNKWREENPAIEPDLSGAGLYRADLRGANLSEANCNGAYLSEANLMWANLNGANLGGATQAG